MVLSSAIVCDRDRRIADDRRSSFHMIADDRRPYCDLRSAICDPRSYGNQALVTQLFLVIDFSLVISIVPALFAFCILHFFAPF